MTGVQRSRDNPMSSQTKDFLEKICFKRAATVDMTQFGFINDSKVHPVNLLLKPLRQKINSILSGSSVPKKPTKKHPKNKRRSTPSPVHKARPKRKKLVTQHRPTERIENTIRIDGNAFDRITF